MIKLGYEAGHGLHTPGKRTPDNEREWTFNNIVATAFANELSKYDGIMLNRFDDPTGQKDIILGDRTKAINDWSADYHISFHHNGFLGKWGTHTGVETYVYTYPSTKQINLANAIHPALVSAYGLRDRGVKKQDLAICRDIKKSGERVGILVEGGFMDSTIDINVLRDKDKLENAGILIAQAVAEYLKLAQKITPVTPSIVNTTSKQLVLPATATSWNVYPTNKAPVKANTIGTLNPKKFGGLTYDIIGNPQKDVYTIKTANYGTVNIYAAPSTGATIKNTTTVQPKPTPQPTPQPSKKYLKLPATATSWNIYPTNKAPIKANAIGSLNPKKFGGLTYEILGNPQSDVYTIKTSNFGTVNIYAAKSTGAIIG